MFNSYIFSGIALCLGKYEITNNAILEQIKIGYISGFDEERILEKFPEEKKPFDFMVSEKMGFSKRYHVVSFPPLKNKYKNAKNSVDLCVDAVNQVFRKSNLSENDIDAWFFSSGTHSQKAPGIGEMVKAYFTDFENNTPVYTITSACVGFNINLEAAISFLKINQNSKHILIAHSDVMSELLLDEKNFVPFATFGDAAVAVILSKVETQEQVGVIDVFNGEDLQMLDFLGANKNGNLYMNPQMVKSRAVPNIIKAANILLNKINWQISDLQYFIPHQTGNAIVDEITQNLDIEKNKVFKEVQKNYGNLSGSSIPACFQILTETKRLIPKAKILSSVAGLGGEFGGFAYIVPEDIPKFTSKSFLKNKTILITGASGKLGQEITKIAAEKAVELILMYNSSEEKINNLITDCKKSFPKLKISKYKCDFSETQNIEIVINEIRKNHIKINYIIVTHAVTGSLLKASKVEIVEFDKVMNINYLSIKKLCESLEKNIMEAILITGSVAEEAQFSGSTAYVSSKRALRAFARNFANKIYETKQINCIYYLPGLIDSGMVEKLNTKQQKSAMTSIKQQELIPVKDIAERMLKAIEKLKIEDVQISFEDNLKIICDGF